MRDFVAAWDKVMNLDRFDLVATGPGRAAASGRGRRLGSLPIPLQQSAGYPLRFARALLLTGVCAESPGHEHIVMERRRPGPQTSRSSRVHGATRQTGKTLAIVGLL